MSDTNINDHEEPTEENTAPDVVAPVAPVEAPAAEEGVTTPVEATPVEAPVEPAPVKEVVAPTPEPEVPAVVVEPTPATAVIDENTIQKVGDTVNTPGTQGVVEETPVEGDATVTTPADSEAVKELKIKLAAFAKSNADAVNSDGYAYSAQLTLAITNYVIRLPKQDVLQALLDFFIQNVDGVCGMTEYMKGSITLSTKDEEKVAWLYNVFYALAIKSTTTISATMATSIFKTPDIMGFYNRKLLSFKK